MGGCRCHFRQCTNSTQTAPGYHFFHFPIRDPARCQRWAEFSANEDFLLLHKNALRNKVVCQDHFKNNCFMNIKKESLVKTAVPTLYIHNGVLVDLDSEEGQQYMLDNYVVVGGSEETPLINVTMPQPQTPTLKRAATKDDFRIVGVQKRRIMEDNDDAPAAQTNENFIVNLKIDKVTSEAGGMEVGSAPVQKLLNSLKMESEKKVIKKRIPIILNNAAPKLLNTGEIISTEMCNTTDDIDSLESYDVVHEMVIPTTSTSSIVQHHPQTPYEPRLDKETVEETLRTVIHSADILTQEVFIQKYEEEQLEMQSVHRILTAIQHKQHEMMEQLQKAPAPTTVDSTTPAKQTPSEPKSKFTQNKMQLFNGIKKYLSPAMVTLLRIELFGNADRDWKSDEKSMLSEVLRQGPSVYEFMRDEWRLRFPPMKNVETWMSEDHADDDDDC